MEIKRNVNDTEMTFELTKEEMRNAAAESIHSMLMEQTPAALTRAIINKNHVSAEAMEEAYDATLEELLHPANINEHIVIPAINHLDPDTSLNAALNGVIGRYLDILPVLKNIRDHIRTYDDSMVAASEDDLDKMEHDRAERAFNMINAVKATVTAEADEAGKCVEEFCKERYGHALTELLDWQSPFYLPLFAAEMSIIVEATHVGDVEYMAIARLVLNSLHDPIINEDGGIEELHSGMAAIMHFICTASCIIEESPDDICDELYGCGIIDALNPENETYILIPIEDDEDNADEECCCGEEECECECECLYSCEEDMPRFEFLMRTVLGNARDEADDELVGLLMQIAAGTDPDFPVSDWPCCDCCGLPIFPCDCDWEVEDDDDDDGMEICNLKGEICPICGQPIEHDCEVACCRCGDCECECEDDDEDEDNGICPVCGASLDQYPADEEDPDQMKLYED